MPGRVGRHYLWKRNDPSGRSRNDPSGRSRPADGARPEDSSAAPGWLREAWRLRSLAVGWRIPGDCDSEAVDEVLAACRNRAPASGEAGLAAVRASAPLSGLATVPYLRTRLAEVYREAEQDGRSPAETHRLLVVRLPRRPDPWRRLAVPILIGRDLRTAFPGGETLSLAGAGPVIALITVRPDLPLRYGRLRQNILATFGTQIRMTPLPERLAEAMRLVDELAC
jgi:hypothetical protein